MMKLTNLLKRTVLCLALALVFWYVAGSMVAYARIIISQRAYGSISFASGDTLNHGSGGIVKLHGLTLSSGELGALDGVTLGATLDSKVWTSSASGKTTLSSGDSLNLGTGIWQIGSVSVTSAAAELNYVDITTLGTSQDSKAATYSATGKHTVAGADSTAYAATGILSAPGRLAWTADSVVTIGATGKTTSNPGALTVAQTLTVSGATVAAAVTASGLITADSLIVYDFAALAVIETALDTTSMPGVAATDVALAFPSDTLFTGMLARCITDGIEITVADAGSGTKKMNVVAIRPK